MSTNQSTAASSTSTQARPTPKRNPAAGPVTWLDDRIGLAGLLKKQLRKVFPDHWSFMLGEIVEPEYEGVALNNAKAKAAVIVVRMRPQDITPLPERADWGIGGILCYSKICTHVGCPISLWEQQTHSVLCPCHQSTFDLADNAKVIFGPANRPLPQLPLALDSEGYIIAASDFTEPVGPSYWERG